MQSRIGHWVWPTESGMRVRHCGIYCLISAADLRLHITIGINSVSLNWSNESREPHSSIKSAPDQCEWRTASERKQTIEFRTCKPVTSPWRWRNAKSLVRRMLREQQTNFNMKNQSKVSLARSAHPIAHNLQLEAICLLYQLLLSCLDFHTHTHIEWLQTVQRPVH